MALSNETRALLALHLVPRIGQRMTAVLLERYGSAEKVFQAPIEELQEIPRIGAEVARNLHHSWATKEVEAEIELLHKHDVNVIARGEPGYPEALHQIDDPPALLYVGGQLVAEDARAIAIVGSRHCTSYGKRVAERLGNDLARAGFTIVSGLARGIDEAVHRGALQSGRTLAVLAGGLSKIYPPEHAELARQVRARGALLTESSMRMEPMPGMFPARNRIISGLCRAVVVVEAAEKSGALITAQHAGDQGRDVFAIPGQVDSPASGGTLQLLRQGAKLVRHAGDILEELQGLSFAKNEPLKVQEPVPTAPPGLTEVEKKIWDFLAEQPHNVEDLARQVAKSMGELSGILMGLELKKLIRRLPGSLYERV
jgi:DNA processing protein